MIPANYRKNNDTELVLLCLQGDSQAWETLISRYKRLIYSIPVRFNFAPADAADVFQATCLALIEHLHELRDERRLSSWLFTTAYRHCIRLQAQHFREPGADEEEVGDSLDPSENMEEMRLQLEERQAIRESVELLPDRCRDLIAMLYLDVHGAAYEEIAKALSIPISSVGPNRARCLEKLRTILRRKGIK